MSDTWSKEIQSSEILYYSRFSRFNDYNKDEWFNLLNIKDGMKILEVGCGPGHFTNMIKKHFPNCSVFGVDLDSGHIDFAKRTAESLNLSVDYQIADVCQLPFEDNEFDLVFSHTLVEHLPFDKFISDQKRVLKNGGKVIFIHVEGKRKHIDTFTFKEKEINEIIERLVYKENDIRVGQYLMSPGYYLKQLTDLNFKNINVQFKEILFYSPDTAGSIEQGLTEIEWQELSELFNLEFNLNMSINGNNFRDKLILLTKEKYAERKKMYLENIKIFDYESTPINVYYGVK